MTLSIQEDGGGDYTTLDEGFDNASTAEDINIEGAWDNDDTREAVIAVDCQIACLSTSKHPGYWDESVNHYRLVGNGGHALTLSGAWTATIDGIAIEQEGTGSSDECFRCVPGTSDSVTIKNSLLHCSTNTSQQDGIYTGFATAAGDINVEQCKIWGANRGGIHSQQEADAIEINVNSCTIWNNGLGGVYGNGGICNSRSGSTSVVVVNVHNSLVVGNSTGDAEDFHSESGDWTLNVSYSITSDASITSEADSGTGNLESRTPRDATAGGNEVLFEDITSAPYDLRLLDDETNNDAQDMHSTATAHSLTIPSTDIMGTSRPQNTDYDCGAFEISVGGGPAGHNVHFMSLLGVS